jgi:hypothetical protein
MMPKIWLNWQVFGLLRRHDARCPKLVYGDTVTRVPGANFTIALQQGGGDLMSNHMWIADERIHAAVAVQIRAAEAHQLDFEQNVHILSNGFWYS